MGGATHAVPRKQGLRGGGTKIKIGKSKAISAADRKETRVWKEVAEAARRQGGGGRDEDDSVSVADLLLVPMWPRRARPAAEVDE